LYGIAGTSNYGGVAEATFNLASTSNSSANPKFTCTNDTDGDGIPNHLDLDSDGDACPDAKEASVIGTLTTGSVVNLANPNAASGTATSTTSGVANAIAAGTSSANGFADALETATESGLYSGTYTYDYAISKTFNACTDTDSDGIPDLIDIDDDNDGILDAVEEANCNNCNGHKVNYKFLNETFGTGTGRTTINTTYDATTTYCYEDGIVGTNTAACPSQSTKILDDGEYCVVSKITGTIASDPDNIHGDLAWYNGEDHTTGDTNGRMAVFNATTNAPLTYSFWILNLDRSDAPGIGSRNRPNISVEFRDLSNNLISTISTGDIAPTSAGNPTGDWYNFSASFVPTTTGFSIVFRNNQPGGLGNDLALDDIMITQTLTDSDQDGEPDVYDLDSDNDGIGGIVEDGWSALSNGKDRMDLSGGTWIDANGNGWHDTTETHYTSQQPANFDGDAVPNYIDLDSDNDAVFDVDEAGLLNGDGDLNCDGKGEGTDTDYDGILNPFDSLVGFGNSGKSLPTNTLGSGNPDYLKLASKTVGVFDISTTLYSCLDTNNNGVIDGSTDIDKDGILDAFDTDTSLYGSPRDLNRKLFLDFDGRNDYGQGAAILGGFLMAWIDLKHAWLW